MGSLNLPDGGLVYLDTSPIIYAVEKISPFAEILYPLWLAAKENQFQLIGSELLLVETLVKPVKLADIELETAFRNFLNAREMLLTPISRAVLEETIRLRAAFGLKTPDAIHAATALLSHCALFITNDGAFRRVPDLPVVVLHELITTS